MHQYLWFFSGVYLRRMINEEKYKQEIIELCCLWLVCQN